MGISNHTDPAPQCTKDTSSSPTGTPPVIVGGVVYQSRLAAHIAALLEAPRRVVHRRHRLLLDGEERPVVPDLWLPEDNRFVFVYHEWPSVEECQRHAAVAALGHTVTVFVGAGLGAVARTPDTPNVTQGWTLEAFTGELARGWTTFAARAGKPVVAQVTSPAAAMDEGIRKHMREARRRVDNPDEIDLSATLGKSLRLRDS